MTVAPTGGDKFFVFNYFDGRYRSSNIKEALEK
jgi:hypothetical protein